jgi:hypothetical protein
MVEALITLQTGAWVVAHLGTLPSTGGMTLRRLLLLLLMMMGHRGVDDLHLVILPRGSWTALFGTIFAAGANPIQISSLEGSRSSRRDGSSSSSSSSSRSSSEVVPARRWGRLGAVDGGGGATRIAGITGEIKDRVGERPEIGTRTSGGDFGDLTSVGDDGMGVFVVLLDKGGVRRTFFGRHDEQQKVGRWVPKRGGCNVDDGQRLFQRWMEGPGGFGWEDSMGGRGKRDREKEKRRKRRKEEEDEE